MAGRGRWWEWGGGVGGAGFAEIRCWLQFKLQLSTIASIELRRSMRH